MVASIGGERARVGMHGARNPGLRVRRCMSQVHFNRTSPAARSARLDRSRCRPRPGMGMGKHTGLARMPTLPRHPLSHPCPIPTPSESCSFEIRPVPYRPPAHAHLSNKSSIQRNETCHSHMPFLSGSGFLPHPAVGVMGGHGLGLGYGVSPGRRKAMGRALQLPLPVQVLVYV